MKWIHVNPAAEMPLPRYELRLAERILSEGDVQLLLVAQRPRDHVLLHLLYTGGLRVSEACRLRWRNLSPRGEAGQITVMGKGGRTRAVALPPELWTALNQLRKGAGNESPVFASKSGQPLDRGRVWVILRRVAEKAGVADKTPQISPHWLRHAHASHALDRGAPLSLVRDTLGHASISTTSAYLHARPGDSSARFLVIREQAEPAVSQEPKARQTNTVAQQARRVAPGGGRSRKDAMPPKKGPQSAKIRL
jgi:integrase/recombinase XerD